MIILTPLDPKNALDDEHALPLLDMALKHVVTPDAQRAPPLILTPTLSFYIRFHINYFSSFNRSFAYCLLRDNLNLSIETERVPTSPQLRNFFDFYSDFV